MTDFSTEKGQEKLHQYDFEIYSNEKYKKIFVPIFRPECFGVHMAIDEKHINNQFYTVLSNAKTGKVALLCSTIRTNELKICLDKFGQLLDTVSYVTLDLSPTFELVVNKNFTNAIQIADKFHVVKNGLEYLQAIRIRLKQEEINNLGAEPTRYSKQTELSRMYPFI